MMIMKAVFLDRDGTVNADSTDRIKSWNEFRFLPGAKKAIANLSKGGFLIFIVTNQAGVAKGFLTKSDLDEIHTKMKADIESAGGRLDAIFSCIHHPDEGCACRKPKTGLLDMAKTEFGVDFSKSFMIGDKQADIEAGKSAGCTTVLVKTGIASNYKGPQPDIVARDLLDAAALILKNRH